VGRDPIRVGYMSIGMEVSKKGRDFLKISNLETPVVCSVQVGCETIHYLRSGYSNHTFPARMRKSPLGESEHWRK
jgi:hypothetical protein